MDLGGWLRSLGLAQYEAVFRENAIDAEVLHDLTEDHLREMGLPLGARLPLRKRMYSGAIAQRWVESGGREKENIDLEGRTQSPGRLKHPNRQE